jgi:cysteine desulfurase
MSKRPVYLDNASTTSVQPDVLRAMLPYFSKKYGNPSNLYVLGREAKRAIAYATKEIINVLHCKEDEFIFTGSATEADNLALIGVARANKKFGNQIIISEIEHKSIASVANVLEREGFEIITIGVNSKGLTDLKELRKQINEKTILVSITMADSETGTLQPIVQIADIVKQMRMNNIKSLTGKGKTSGIKDRMSATDRLSTIGHPFFHTDASQASTYANINVNKLGVDLMTLSAHKIGGPKGIGGLYLRRGIKISPLIHGGGQQSHLRSGTENVPAIVGFGRAMALNEKNKEKECMRIKSLRDYLERGLFRLIPKIILNGHEAKRLPNFLNISFLDIEGEALLLHLDKCGIMVNTGSACDSESLEPSPILTALGNPYEFVHGSIRFTLGKETTKKDIDYTLKHMPDIVKKLRRISPLNLSLKQKKSISNPKAFIGNQTPHFVRKVKSKSKSYIL